MSTFGCCFHFGSVSSCFPELFLHWSPVAYWAPTNLGSSSLSVLSFAFSCCSWGSQGKNTAVVCHSLLQWTILCENSPPWPICLGWPYMSWLSFTELGRAVVHVISLISSVIVVFVLSAFSLIRIRGLWKLPDGRDCLWGKLSHIYD